MDLTYAFTSPRVNEMDYIRIHITQAWGEYWTKVLEYKYKYLKK